MTLHFEELSPTRLMTASELKQAKQLLRQLDRHFVARKKDELRPRKDQLGYSQWQLRRKVIDREINASAATVLEPETRIS